MEYNQLDPLLKTQGDRKGDVADPATGYSPYPGNSNILILGMDAYVKTLRGEDQGVVVEFVNPKYKDETRTEFAKAIAKIDAQRGSSAGAAIGLRTTVKPFSASSPQNWGFRGALTAGFAFTLPLVLTLILFMLLYYLVSVGIL